MRRPIWSNTQSWKYWWRKSPCAFMGWLHVYQLCGSPARVTTLTEEWGGQSWRENASNASLRALATDGALFKRLCGLFNPPPSTTILIQAEYIYRMAFFVHFLTIDHRLNKTKKKKRSWINPALSKHQICRLMQTNAVSLFSWQN